MILSLLFGVILLQQQVASQRFYGRVSGSRYLRPNVPSRNLPRRTMGNVVADNNQVIGVADGAGGAAAGVDATTGIVSTIPTEGSQYGNQQMGFSRPPLPVNRLPTPGEVAKQLVGTSGGTCIIVCESIYARYPAQSMTVIKSILSCPSICEIVNNLGSMMMTGMTAALAG